MMPEASSAPSHKQSVQQQPVIKQPPDAVAELIHGRYRVLSIAGRGGMAFVYEAEDTHNRQRVALKRLLDQENPEIRRRSLELFELEYQTLSQLKHPRIVEVYDYAVDEKGAYYTMELLSGGDASEQIFDDWRQACAMARNVCSALSLLHSRGMVHRDLSPRNVRCTQDGTAKLIDFGAMVPMGRNRYSVVGTPAYCAPEALGLQPLDARADLFALGATLFYALTGRHAHPAKEFKDLGELWRCELPRPSDFAEGIPEPLDALVLAMLSQDPDARPSSAAEVLARLSAIEGCALDEQLLVAQAYLSTPSLVGRGTHLARTRTRLTRALRGAGAALLVKGPSGVGRSRFLDACVLQAKLLGARTIRVDADDAVLGDYGAVRAIARQLLDALGGDALEAARPALALLGHVVPELLALAPDTELAVFENDGDARPRLQTALRQWFFAISRKRPFVLAVDDAHRIDEPSVALIALLTDDLRHYPVFVIATLDSEATAIAPAALRLLADRASRIDLPNLKPADTEKLLGSVFGDAPNVGLLVHHFYQISSGNPRAVMRLAQHLVDRKIASYQAGSWSLPASFDAADLPQSIAEELSTRVGALTPDARELASALALIPDQSVTTEELLQITGHGNYGRLLSSLEELVKAEIFRFAGETVVLAQQAWVPTLRAALAEDSSRALNLKLAQLFERRGGCEFRVGQHLLRTHERARGVQVLAHHAEVSREETGRNADLFFKLIQSLPAEWFETFEEALRAAEETAQPKASLFHLRARLASIMSLNGRWDMHHIQSALIADLSRCSGLADWQELDSSMEPRARLMTALGRARARYEASAEQERILDPTLAIRHLARALIETAHIIAATLDMAQLKALPSLAPLTVLSPTLGVVHTLFSGMLERQTGRYERARLHYLQLLERTAEPDRAGMDESHHRYTRLGVMNGLAMIEAGMGLESSLRWAEQIESHPTYQVNAVQIRMLYHLWQGDIREAARCKRQVEVLRIQNSPRQWFEGSHLLWQISGSAAAEDLARVKQTTEEIEVLARSYPQWVPPFRYGMGEYHRIRGDYAKALVEFESGLETATAGEHQLWPSLTGAHVQTLHALGRDEQALDFGSRYLLAAQQADLGYLTNYLLMPLSVVQAKLGQREQAVVNAEAAIESFRSLGSKGLNMSLAYQARARVALALKDDLAFERYAQLSQEAFGSVTNSTLRASQERLKRERQRGQMMSTTQAVLNTAVLVAARVASTLNACTGVQERAECVLGLLAEAYGTSEGFLYLLGEAGPYFAAQLGDREWPASIQEMADEYLSRQMRDDITTTGNSSAHVSSSTELPSSPERARCRPVLLSHASGGGLTITGVAVLSVSHSAPTTTQVRLAGELSRQLAGAGDSNGRTLTGSDG